MSLFLLAPLLAAAAALPETRTFWRVEDLDAVQPTHIAVPATLVAAGEHIAVYQEEGYRFSTTGKEDEQAQISRLVTVFDQLIYPEQTARFGPCPDRDGNGLVLALVTDLGHRSGYFWPFDALPEEEAHQLGMRSNHGEILYLSFRHQGNRASENLGVTARMFHQLLHHTHKPRETDWRRLLANHAAFAMGLVSERGIWGDLDPRGSKPAAGEPFEPDGWGPLFVQYLVDQQGPGILPEILAAEPTGLAGLQRVLERRRSDRTATEMLADFGMARWMSDPVLADGRFHLDTVPVPRPASTRLPASRPASASTPVGVGGTTYLMLDGDDKRPLPLTLQGDPGFSWQARAVRLTDQGPDEVLHLEFDETGVAKLELAELHSSESVILAVTPMPRDPAGRDRARLSLQWGLGWVPHLPVDVASPRLAQLTERALPDGGTVARSRIIDTLAALSGQIPKDGERLVVSTRYAWAPESSTVLDVLEEKAARRRLPSRRLAFAAPGNEYHRQEWHNLLIELPGTDSRRWPIVVAAHWDGARGDVENSYLRALNVDTNATGVAVAMEVASAVSQSQHRAPVIVAFLAGGRHGAAGAEALLDHLNNQVAVWIELEGIGVPEQRSRDITVRLEGLPEDAIVAGNLARALRRAGLVPAVVPSISDSHSGVPLASSRGVQSVLIRTRDGMATALEIDVPPEAEMQQIMPDLLVLITKLVADMAGTLASPA